MLQNCSPEQSGKGYDCCGSVCDGGGSDCGCGGGVVMRCGILGFLSDTIADLSSNELHVCKYGRQFGTDLTMDIGILRTLALT
jgi:hypothetical protein